MKVYKYKNIIINLPMTIFSIIISIIIIFSISYNCDHYINYKLSMYPKAYLVLLAVIFLFILFVINCLYNINIILKNIEVSKKNIILYALPCIFIWTLYLIAFYPGIMTADSFSQWHQVHLLAFDDWHPVMHTLFIFAVTRIWDAPQAVALAQILVFSLTVGYGLYSFQKIGIDKKVLFVISIMIAIFPPNGLISIAIWKDLMYNCSLAVLTVIAINIFFTNGKWIDSRLNISFFILISLGVIFFRHNGIVPFIGTMILLIVIYRKEKLKRYLIAFSVIAAVSIFIEFPLFSLLKVTRAESSEAFGIPVQQIAAVIKYNGYLTEAQKQKIGKIMPLKSLSENYAPYVVDYVKFNENFNSKVIENDKAGFLKLWFNVCMQNPGITVRAYLIQTSIIWQIQEPTTYGGYTNTVPRKVYKNNDNIANKIVSQNITYWCNKIIDFTQTRKAKFIFWRPAFPLFIIFISGFVLALKNGKKSLILISPIIFNVLSLCITIPAQDYRYLHANYLIAVMIILAVLVRKTKSFDIVEAVE